MLFADTAPLGATNSCALTVTASLFTACTWKQRLSIFECPESKLRTCATQLLRFIAAALATTRNLISYMWMWAECGAGRSQLSSSRIGISPASAFSNSSSYPHHSFTIRHNFSLSRPQDVLVFFRPEVLHLFFGFGNRIVLYRHYRSRAGRGNAK